MVYRGGGPPRARGRGRPFRARRGRGWRPYRGRGANRGAHQEEGLRITLRNVGADSQRDRREGSDYDRHSDPRDHESERREDYDYGEEGHGQGEGYDEGGYDRPRRDSRDSPPRKRPHMETDIPTEESLRITVGNELYSEGRGPERREPPLDQQRDWDREGGLRNDRWEDRRENWQQDRRDDRNWEDNREGYDERRDNKRDYDSGYRGRGRGRPHYPRGFDSSRGQRGGPWRRGRDELFGDSHRGRGRGGYGPSERAPPNRDQDWDSRHQSFSHERRQSRSPGRRSPGRGRRSSQSRSRGRSPERRSYSRTRRSYSRSRSGSRGRRSYSRGRSSSQERRSFSRGRSYSRSRSRSRRRSYSRDRRSVSQERRSLSHSPVRERRSISRGRSRERRVSSRERSYSRNRDRSQGQQQTYDRDGTAGDPGPSPIESSSAEVQTRGGERKEEGTHRSRSREPASSSGSSSSSSRSSPSDGGNKSHEISEKEYEQEMYRRLKSELTANYADPREREERIAKHIREMAKLSPALFRQFMSKNAGNLSAMALMPSEEEPTPENLPEPAADQKPPSESAESKPLRSILKRKGDSLSPPGSLDRNPSPPPEKPLSQIEKVIHSLRKGAKPEPEKESTPPPKGALRQISSYMDDIEDEEEFLYGDSSKSEKAGTDPALPFWSANRFEEKPVEKLEKPHEPKRETHKHPLDMFEELTSHKPAEAKVPSAFDNFEEKEKSYEQWRATIFQKTKTAEKPKEPEPTHPAGAESSDSSENLSSTVENILKSIGFNFDLSRRMQELARQKKEQEQQCLTINQSASFLGSADLLGDIQASVFQKEMKPDVKGDMASLVEEVRIATKLAQEKAKKAKELEDRHMKKQKKDSSQEKDSGRRDSSDRHRSWDRDREQGPHVSRGDVHSPYEPTEPQGQFYQDLYTPQYDEYGYENYDFYSGSGSYPPDYEDPHRPKPVRTSNLISLAGDSSKAEEPSVAKKGVSAKKESSPPRQSREWSPDRSCESDRRSRKQEASSYKREEEERGYKKSGQQLTDGNYKQPAGHREESNGSKEEASYKRAERILIVKKVEDAESPGSDAGFTRRIVLPPKEKLKSRTLDSDVRREVIRRSASPSKRMESPSSAKVSKRAASPVASPKQAKQARGDITSPSEKILPEASKSKPESGRSRWEPVTEAPRLKAESAKDDLSKFTIKPQPSKIDTEHAKALAQEKLKLLRQQEEQKEKIRLLEERKEKLRILERELAALKQQHNELLRKRRRQKDGHKDPLLTENCKLQDEITAQIKALREGRDIDSHSGTAIDKSQGEPTSAKAKGAFGDDALSSLTTKVEEKSAVCKQAVKMEESKVCYEYFDPGSHWCRPCNVMCGHMFDFFKHIESKKHQQKLDPFDKPWLMEALQKSEAGKMKEGPVQAHPIKGLEFMMATRAFYCSLCKEFCGDLSVAESHMKSDEHTEKYREYIREHPYYEKRYMLERSASLSMQRPYSPEHDEDESSNDNSSIPSSGSKKKDKRNQKEGQEKKKSKSDKEEKKKSDKDEKKKLDKDEKKYEKDEKKKHDRDRKDCDLDEKDYDRDRRDYDRDDKDYDQDEKYDRDGKKYDKDGRRKREKREYRGLPAEDEYRMYSDRQEFKRNSDREEFSKKKDAQETDKSRELAQSPRGDQSSTASSSKEDQPSMEPEKEKAESSPAEDMSEKAAEKVEPSAENEKKEPESDSKAKIPIKLTGKTGIKPATSLPPWKVLTRPIPKSNIRSRLLATKIAASAATVSTTPGLAPPIQDPVPLEDFLTVGFSQKKPVPVVSETYVSKDVSESPSSIDLPAPKDPKTGKVETDLVEEVKEAGTDSGSTVAGIQPVAPPPPLEDVPLPPEPQPGAQAASSNTILVSQDSAESAGDDTDLPAAGGEKDAGSDSDAEPAKDEVNSSSDTDSYDSVKERKLEAAVKSASDSAKDAEAENLKKDGEDMPVLDSIPLPEDIPPRPNAPVPTSTQPTATVSLLPDEPMPMGPFPLPPPPTRRSPRKPAPGMPPQGGYMPPMMPPAGMGPQQYSPYPPYSGPMPMYNMPPHQYSGMGNWMPGLPVHDMTAAGGHWPRSSLLSAPPRAPPAPPTPEWVTSAASAPAAPSVVTLVTTTSTTAPPPAEPVEAVPTSASSSVPESFSASITTDAAPATSVPESSKADVVSEEPSGVHLEAEPEASEEISSAPEPERASSPVPESSAEAPSTVSSSQPVTYTEALSTSAASPSNTAPTVSDSQTTTPSAETAQETVAAAEDSPTSIAPRGRRGRMRGQARAPASQRQTRSRTTRRVAAESASPAPADTVSCGEDSEESVAEISDLSAESSEATPGSRNTRRKTGGRGRKAALKKEASDSHEAVAAVKIPSSPNRGCVLDLTNPPVDSSVQSLVGTEVTSSSVTAAESSASESEAQCKSETKPETAVSADAPQAEELSVGEDSALNLTVPPQQRRARRGRVVEQTEPEDLSAKAEPQDLRTSSSSKQKTLILPEMPMDLSVRLVRLPVTQSNVSLSSLGSATSEDMAQFLEMVQSPSSQISSSDMLQRSDSVDSLSVKDTLLSSTSALNPSTCTPPLEPDLSEEPNLVEEQPSQMPGSPGLGVDPEGDPVDFSLEPMDFEELVGMEENSEAAPPSGRTEDNTDSTDTGI